MSVTIYHNPACGTSRNTLAMIRQSGEEPEVIEYLKTPPSRARLVELIEALGISPRALLREKGTPYAELGLADPKWSDDELIDFMLAHPILINRPIVVTPKGVRLCRPSELVLDLLDNPIESFVKEDGEVDHAREALMAAASVSSRLRGIMAYGTYAPLAPDELAGQPGPHWLARKRPDPRFLRALPRRRPRPVARARLHRHAAPDFRGPRLSLERHRDQRERHVSNMVRPTRAMPRRHWRRSTFYHMLEHGHEDLPIDLADCDHLDFAIDRGSRRQRPQASRRLCAPVRRGRHHGPDGLRLFLLDDAARRGLWRAGPGGVARPGAGAGACDQDPRRRPISRRRWAGSISAATPPNRCCADASRAASPSSINAVLWFSDLRGSTAISESIEPGRDHPVPQ